MKEYYINQDTIILFKSGDTTIVYEEEKKFTINNTLKTILNNNCVLNGSTLDGRIDAARSILNIKYRVPIIISNSKDKEILLMPIFSLRSENSIYININKIINVKKYDDFIRVYVTNNQYFDFEISLKIFENVLFNSIKLKNIINWQNKRLFL